MRRLRRFKSYPEVVLLGYPKCVWLTRAWISTIMGRDPSIMRLRIEPTRSSWRCARSSFDGFGHSISPFSVILKIPTSLVVPNLFL